MDQSKWYLIKLNPLQLRLSYSSIQLLSFDQQGLLAVPFVLHSQPTVIFEPQKESTEQMALIAQKRYLDIMRDVEELIIAKLHQPSAHRVRL